MSSSSLNLFPERSPRFRNWSPNQSWIFNPLGNLPEVRPCVRLLILFLRVFQLGGLYAGFAFEWRTDLGRGRGLMDWKGGMVCVKEFVITALQRRNGGVPFCLWRHIPSIATGLSTPGVCDGEWNCSHQPSDHYAQGRRLGYRFEVLIVSLPNLCS
jgi:hypothetical protein